MTNKPRNAEAGSAGPAPGGSAQAGPDKSDGERVVVRDKRRIDASGGKGEPTEPPAGDDAAGTGTDAESAGIKPQTSTEAELAGESAERAADAEAEAGASTGGDKPVVDAPAEPVEEPADRSGPLGAELAALRSDLDERTRDVQRVSAEYANYRKRVDRDRGLVAEQTTGNVLTALLPILDDLDRAREHGDLVGPFGAVAEQLGAALGKFGLTAFGEKGDPFDPTRHEAVAHRTSSEVTEPTCVEVMRRGYQLGERLLRPALVAVADPE
ncbi:nucleotide exchange factor GrpE [Plantactinospora sp. KBS50]|uniref:nucleotide exchange factor GrpE n=1 Tax=Plantactinospora sp. KBS50 TaxID=2024580 RepID=UPI000BAAE3DA|nr:nucleotide exchange factor GrpE [Plantactinospora sp. KBS50]ASW53021.1 nucleotide exchange factor GrpE [Plantactinospora sp. KBS50]